METTNVIVRENNLNNLKNIKNKTITVSKHDKIHHKENVSDENFVIPAITDYNIFLTKNYKLAFLKVICKHYSIRVTGTKPDLIERIFKQLRETNHTVRIQKNLRIYFYKKYIKLLGPGLIYRKSCINGTDFFTLENMVEIPQNQFISFRGKDNNIWGFNIISLYNLFLKGANEIYNPYNREKLDINILFNIQKIVVLAKILNITTTLTIEQNTEKLSVTKKIELKTLDLFMSIDELGNYTNKDWFIELNKAQLIKFLRELADIWGYRAQLSDLIKAEICPPHGELFRNINLTNIVNLEYIDIQRIALCLMEKLVKSGINRDSKSIGAYYVLAALTLVSIDASEALPWLYQSVANIY